MSAFDDYFAKMMPDVEKWAAQFAAEPVTARPAVAPMGEPFQARKIVSYAEIPDELAMDLGIIPDTRPKPPPLPWRWQLRNRIGDWRERAARRAYKIIAGEWPHDREDDW